MSTNELVEWGVAHLTYPGQQESGDLHVVAPFDNGVLLGVVDGLGHGSEAAAAARAAVAILEAYRSETVVSLVQRCHRSLAATRGVVMTLAAYSGLDQRLSWVGVGNVEGVLLRFDPLAHPKREVPPLRGGVVGYQLPTLRVSVVRVYPGDTLVLATDGVGRDFAVGLTAGEPPQEIADRILARHGKGTDDAVVLVTRFVRGDR